MTEISGAPHVTVEPAAFREALPIAGIPYSTYNVVLWTFLSYGTLAALDDYDTLLVGHPGHSGGAPARPLGTGIEWGVDDAGVEWWLTEVEGLDGSPTWAARSEEPAVGDGTWVLDVRAPGREVTLTGSLVATTPAALATAVVKAGATLSARPRTGWLTWDAPDAVTKKLPVALAQQVKVKRVGALLAEVEMVLLGIDAGTAGAGVYLEGDDVTTWTLVSTVVQHADVPGAVPTPPTVVIVGPVSLGAVVTLGDYQFTTTAAIPADTTAVIDCRTRLVTVNDALDRSLVTLLADRWPILPVDDLVDISATFAGGGSIIVQATPLWG